MLDSVEQIYRFICAEDNKDVEVFSWHDDKADRTCKKTFGELGSDICRWISFFNNQGIELKGKHVGFLGLNSYDYIVGLYSTVFTGAVFVPLNYLEADEVIEDELEFADVDFIVADAVCLKMRENPLNAYAGRVYEMSDYRSVKDDPHPFFYFNNDPDVLLGLVFTSGTTGKNKAVMLTVGNLMALVRITIIEAEMFKSADGNRAKRCLFNLPFYHVSGLSCILTFPVCGFISNLCVDYRYIYRDLQTLGSDFTIAAPIFMEQWEKELRKGSRDKFGTLRIIVYGGAFLKESTRNIFISNGFKIMQNYSMSETFGKGFFSTLMPDTQTNLVGQPTVETIAAIIDGELCLKGPVVTPGYYRNKAESEKTLRDGWLYTGDLAEMDPQGNYYITGRKKNLIILSSGENVSPEELKAIVLKNDLIRDVMIREKDERICAEIYAPQASREEIRSYIDEVNKKLPGYKRMTLVEFRSTPFDRKMSGSIKGG